MLKFIIKQKVSLVIFTLLVSGCSASNQNMVIKQNEAQSKTIINSKGKYCVNKPNMLFSNIVKDLSLAINKPYEYDGETCDNARIVFSNNICFDNLSDLDYYIQNNTNYAIQLNASFNRGLDIQNITIEDAISYFNGNGSDKIIIYYDENIKLENNSHVKLKNMSDLKKYIASTTPFYFIKLFNDRHKVVYSLNYKEIKQKLGDSKAITLNLQKAKQITNSISDLKQKKSIIEKINNIEKGVTNYEN